MAVIEEAGAIEASGEDANPPQDGGYNPQAVARADSQDEQRDTQRAQNDARPSMRGRLEATVSERPLYNLCDA